MSRVVNGVLLPQPPEQWADLPVQRLHPFCQSVRLVMDSSTRLATLLDQNKEEDIARELSPDRSYFLYNLKVFLKIEYLPGKDLLSIIPELKDSLELLKAAFRKRYRPGESKFVVSEINRLITEICDNPRFDNIYLQKDIFTCFCNFFKALNPQPPSAPTNGEAMADNSFYLRANKLINANADLAGTATTRGNSASVERIITEIKTATDKVIDKCGRPTYEFNEKDIFEDKFAAESYVCEVGKAIKKEKPELRGRFAVAEYIMQNAKRGEAFYKECLRIREVAAKHGWTKITTIRQKLQGQHRTKQSTVKRRTQIERKKRLVAQSLAPIRKSKGKNKGNGR